MEAELQRFDTENSDDIEKRWTRYKTKLGWYFTLKNIKQDEIKKTSLFYFGGDGIVDMYEEDADDADNYDAIIKKLDARLIPKQNNQLNRLNFRKIIQYDDEPFNEFVQRIRDKGKICDFADLKQEILSQIINGCTSMDLKKQALSSKDITLDRLIELGRTEESVNKQLKEIKKTAKPSVSSDEEETTNDQINNIKRKANSNNDDDGYANLAEMKRKGLCIRCGLKYPHEKVCPAHDKTCFKCGNLGHYQRFCASKRQKNGQQRQGRQLGQPPNELSKILQAIEELKTSKANTNEYDQTGASTCWRIQEEPSKEDNVCRPRIKLPICGEMITFLIDTGCPKYNVIDEHTYNSINVDRRPILNRSYTNIFAYGSQTPLDILGSISTRTTNPNGCYQHMDFLVIKGESGNIIGCSSALKLGLIEFVASIKNKPLNPKSVAFKDKILKQFPSVFNSKIGRILGKEATIHIDELVKPVKQKLRPIPIHIRSAVENELDNLERQGIIEKVNGPTTWVASIVPVIKKRATPNSPVEIRICTDSRDANRAVIRDANHR